MNYYNKAAFGQILSFGYAASPSPAVFIQIVQKMGRFA
jgi:hypothetical protein